MHQPHATPRPSIYYDYEIHPYSRPVAPESARHTVVIVGAGPIGLVTALDLARYGVPSVLLTAELQVSEGSRALAYTRRSMEILQQVGIGEQVAAQGLPWRSGHSFYRGHRVYRMDIPWDEDDRFAPLTNLQQPCLEALMVARIGQEPLIQLCWGNLVSAVETHDDHVRLTIDTPDGEYALTTDWLIAADGAHSKIRRELGLGMSGDSYEGRFVIADIRADLDLPTERLCFFDPEWNPENTVLMHREPQGIWRIDYQLPEGADEKEALKPQALKHAIDAHLKTIGKGGTPWELDWCSVYSARALTLDDYVHGRVLFCGDAAHMLPIFGVRGANTGWQDCQNLVWKLAMVITHIAPVKLLQSYSHERVMAAREIVDEAGKSARFMAPPSAGFRTLRDATLSLALRHDFVRPLLNWRTSRPHEYRHSPLNTADDDSQMFHGGPEKGAQAKNIRLAHGEYLFDRLGAAFYLFIFQPGGRIAPELLEARERLQKEGIPLSFIVFSSANTKDGQDAPDHVDKTAFVINDPQCRIRRKYGIAGAFGACLVRPDQHVCARWVGLDAGRLMRAVHTALAIGAA